MRYPYSFCRIKIGKIGRRGKQAGIRKPGRGDSPRLLKRE